MAEVQVTAAASGFGSTARRDPWWVEIVPVTERHILLAWSSLLSAGLADLYVRLVASGAIREVRLF